MQHPEARIFLVHSRLQLLLVQHMLAVMPEFSSGCSYLVLDMDGRGLPVEYGRWHATITLDPPIGGTVVGRGRACRRAVGQVRSIVERYHAVALFLSDLQWPLNNALYGRLARRGSIRHTTIELCNFPDGIANLQLLYPKPSQKVRDFIKSLLGACGGAPYYQYSGSTIGLEQFSRIYSLLPNAIPELQPRTRAIPCIRPNVLNRAPQSCLFLGQNYDSFLSPVKFRELSAMAARYVANLGYQRLLYKPHPRERTGDAVEAFEKHGFEILQDARTVEEMFLDWQTECVASYTSSALVHLKLMFGSAVRCLSVYCSRALNATNVTRDGAGRMKTLFTLCGVEVYE